MENELLQAALEGLEAQKVRVEEQIKAVTALIYGGGLSPARKVDTGRRGRSAGAKNKVKAAPKAQKKVGKVGGGTRKLSKAGREAIAAAQRKRWGAIRKAKAQSKVEHKVPVRKTAPKATAKKAVVKAKPVSIAPKATAA